DARFRLVVTDGVFSMDGYMAPLAEICEIAERHDAMVMVDDSHAVGFIGPNGRGTHEHHGVMGRVDAITGTLGKALGGASGGYVSGRRELVAMLRQRSRPYLFSNSVAPPIAAASLKVLELLRTAGDLRQRGDALSKVARPHRCDDQLPAEVRMSLWQLGFPCSELTSREELIARLWARKRRVLTAMQPEWGGPPVTPPAAA